MSPVGLDVREYGWAFFEYTLADALAHTIQPAVVNPGFPTSWLVTRIQGFAPGTGGLSLQLVGSNLVIPAGGCVELLPGGAFRGPIIVQGLGARVLIEYWFQATTNAALPGISVVP